MDSHRSDLCQSVVSAVSVVYLQFANIAFNARQNFQNSVVQIRRDQQDAGAGRSSHYAALLIHARKVARVQPAVAEGAFRLRGIVPVTFHHLRTAYDQFAIRAFEAHTGVPVLLNTSFNENEPIVERPEQALDCFLRTDMDVLVMGPHVLSKAG